MHIFALAVITAFALWQHMVKVVHDASHFALSEFIFIGWLSDA